MVLQPPFARPVLALLCLMTYLTLVPGSWAAGVKVDIDGLEGEQKSNVLQFLSINRLEESELDRREVERAHRLARSEIVAALQPFGYYQPIIESSLTREETRWRAYYQIDAGTPVEITSLELRADGDGAADAGGSGSEGRTRTAPRESQRRGPSVSHHRGTGAGPVGE